MSTNEKDDAQVYSGEVTLRFLIEAKRQEHAVQELCAIIENIREATYYDLDVTKLDVKEQHDV